MLTWGLLAEGVFVCVGVRIYVGVGVIVGVPVEVGVDVRFWVAIVVAEDGTSPSKLIAVEVGTGVCKARLKAWDCSSASSAHNPASRNASLMIDNRNRAMDPVISPGP